ncbi:MAG TPA: endonuclease/exonuclease/phosphatase family protein [Termitinemataceae bacterium]|nr:endonuclease/exonuclease/phosphatase family protein [Termitinemataceae bacterium]HOM24027.1 endonuclease/exonuclease/phosphatase family protein [Termitinemataceae bacterium]HPQ00594.1 endonuclease/exonuclease/phosphatase family protein [Termitinemataceae bacterium]
MGQNFRAKQPQEQLTLVTWNLQALFDGSETGTEYADYRHSKGWTEEKYLERISQIQEALAGWLPQGPDILALEEIENKEVLEALNGCFKEKAYPYAVFSKNADAALGIGVLSRYRIIDQRSHFGYRQGAEGQRPILELVLDTGKESLVVFVCHWKSKKGKDDTERFRRDSAAIIQRRIRELLGTTDTHGPIQFSVAEASENKEDTDLKQGYPQENQKREAGKVTSRRDDLSLGAILVVGDLNENYDEFERQGKTRITALLPTTEEAGRLVQLQQRKKERRSSFNLRGGDYSLEDPSLKGSGETPPFSWPEDVLLLRDSFQISQDETLRDLTFYSPWQESPFAGSYWYKGAWETIDHVLLHSSLGDGKGWEFASFGVAQQTPFVNEEGYPVAYNPQTGKGVSDHLPLLVVLKYVE